MGLSSKDADDLEAMVGSFIRQGLKSPENVAQVTAAINRVIDKVVTSETAQGVTHEQARFSPEARAQLVQLESFQAVTGRPEDMTLKANSSAVAGAMTERLGDLAKGTGPTVDALQASTDSMNGYEAQMARGAHQLHAVDERVKDAKAFLAQSAKELGLDVNPEKPKGLNSALHLLRALEIDEVLRQNPPASPPKPGRRWSSSSAATSRRSRATIRAGCGARRSAGRHRPGPTCRRWRISRRRRGRWSPSARRRRRSSSSGA